MGNPRTLALLALAFLAAGRLHSGESEGVHVSTVIDRDADEVILMESEWISMHLLPRMQAIINRFVFRPTGNDIVEPLVPKIRKLGGGILMDCFWEQDWRFQELKEKPYSYKITKTGPDEAQVVFETDIVGWVGSEGSGIISKLLSNITLRRTVTLKSGQPFFRFDCEFVNNDEHAKRPTFWSHNSSVIDIDGKDSVLRPSARGVNETCAHFRENPPGAEHYIFDFNHGWSARISRARKEGIVYLMDYDYINMLYNCANTTCEWTYDSILSFERQPWRGRIYILPVIGLSGVDYANEYFICEIRAKRDDGKLAIDYYLTSSYEKVAQVMINTEVEHSLLEKEPQSTRLKTISIDGIGIEPASGHVEAEIAAPDPLVLNVTAFAELPDGTVKKFPFQSFYVGEYGLGKNIRRDGKPVKLLHRAVRSPRVPEVPAGLAINRKDCNVFGVFGLGTHRLGLSGAVQSIPGAKLEIGYCTGRDVYGYALGDFPYDYDRLFDFRALILSNVQDLEFRAIGASVLLPWLKAGGGLVIVGGENAFNFELRGHEINRYYPIQPKGKNIRKGPLQLQPPSPTHPIFRGIDVSGLPYLYYYHAIELKEGCGAQVLMKVGEHPFIVEHRTGDQITMAVAANGFGAESDFPGKIHVRKWPQWQKLFANIMQYAAGVLEQ